VFAINEALVVERRSYRDITRQFGVDKSALSRHREHIPELLVKAREALEIEHAEDLATQLNGVKADVHRLKDKAERDGDIRTALSACDKALKALELQAKVEQLIATSPTINVLVTPEWIDLRTRIVRALEHHPEAREDVVRALSPGSTGSLPPPGEAGEWGNGGA
jgi:hypothetical protein